jgi:cryptochrome
MQPSTCQQDTDALLRAAGGRAPQTMQSFTKLIDKVGEPPAPLPAPASLPPPGPLAEVVTSVPTLAEVGFEQRPTTVFKVRRTAGEGARVCAVIRDLVMVAAVGRSVSSSS